ncbi:MAG: S46 family peptidase [Bacteroidales bacterium]|nr:S46 family peptidase [Bacteroidales bacterium]MDD3989699.1 S46 family peptidase [Bacteroidales bacterium]
MKKVILPLIAALLIFVPAKGDEGMWLLPLIEKLNIKKMSELGFRLTAKDIYNINGSSLKDAVVHFGGGCTAEIVSAEGLLLTNHHCGYGAIQKLSTVEHDYLQDGYWAMNRSQELPAPGLNVTFLENITDVTKEVEKALKKADGEKERSEAYKKIETELCSNATKNNVYLNASLTTMYGGNAYYLIVTKTFSDIRFVGAPPSSIGKFGADTDNWMWPRHTGDFSMFRVYAGKDNNPAPYSPDNQPYKAKKHLTISLRGIEPGDFSMIIGYPGRTSRFMTSREVDQTVRTNSIMIEARGLRQEVLMKEMLADPKVRLQYSSKYAGSSNFWKKAMGMNETFKKLKVAERRAQEEEEFAGWINGNKSREERFINALGDLKKAIEEREENICLYRYLTETLGNIEVASVANYYIGIASNLEKGNIETAMNMAKELEGRIDNFFVNYSESTDRKVAKAMIKLFRERVSKDDLPSFYTTIDTRFGGSVDNYVDYLFDKTAFTSKEKISAALNNREISLSEDPALIMGRSIFAMIPPLRNDLNSSSRLYEKGNKTYIAGLLEMKKDQAIYPDANSTMRMTYGQVLNYSPKDGVIYEHVTTLNGVMEKEDPSNWEFVVPAKLKDLYNKKDYGQYAMKNGELPVAFISNNDITGGNSGSPVMNASGELIGIAFDGNWEAMSGDVIFEPNLQRCINVDIRYVLFIMDKFGGAGYLLDEMTIIK